HSPVRALGRSLTHSLTHFFLPQWSNTCYGCDFFYLIYRFVVAVFWIGVLVSSAISDVPWLDPSAGGAMWFLFLSNWSLVILTMNTSLEAFNTLLNRFRRNKSSGRCLMFGKIPSPEQQQRHE
ncbi:hypothetical protein LSH36_708g01060, partial [Paralvinella palmiformis]